MITGWSGWWLDSAPEVARRAGPWLAAPGPGLPVSSVETGEGSRPVTARSEIWWPAMTWADRENGENSSEYPVITSQELLQIQPVVIVRGELCVKKQWPMFYLPLCSAEAEQEGLVWGTDWSAVIQWWACELCRARPETVHTHEPPMTPCSEQWHPGTTCITSASGKLAWQSTDVLCWALAEWPQIPSRAGNISQQRVYYLSDVNKYLGHCWGRNEDDDMQDCQVIGVIIGSVYSVLRVCTALYDYDLHPVNTDSSWQRHRWWFSSLKLDLSSSKKHIIQSSQCPAVRQGRCN